MSSVPVLWNPSYTRADEDLDPATGAHMVQLGRQGTLEQCLKAVEPRWQSDFCNVQNQANGAPTLLLVGPSAAGANDLIKQLPTFNRVRGRRTCTLNTDAVSTG